MSDTITFTSATICAVFIDLIPQIYGADTPMETKI